MPRKRTKTPANFDKEFPRVLRGLMKDTGHTQDELANFIRKKKNLEKFSRQSVSYYCDGSSSPDWETLNVIADFFGVSVGYLTGHEEYKTLDPDVRMICEYTGLSEQAVNSLREASTTIDGKRIKLKGFNQFFGWSSNVVQEFNWTVNCAIDNPDDPVFYDLCGMLLDTYTEIHDENKKEAIKWLLDYLHDLGADTVRPGEMGINWKELAKDTVSIYIEKIREEIADREAMTDGPPQPADDIEGEE